MPWLSGLHTFPKWVFVHCKVNAEPKIGAVTWPWKDLECSIQDTQVCQLLFFPATRLFPVHKQCERLSVVGESAFIFSWNFLWILSISFRVAFEHCIVISQRESARQRNFTGLWTRPSISINCTNEFLYSDNFYFWIKTRQMSQWSLIVQVKSGILCQV